MNDKHKTSSGDSSKKKPKTTEEKTPLFREEAIRHRTRALFGDVVLAAPLSTWIITGLLAVILVGIIAFGVFGSVQVEDENLPIWRWILGRTP